MAVTEKAAPDAPAAKQPSGMLKSLRVRDFRGFRDLRVEGLGGSTCSPGGTTPVRRRCWRRCHC